MKANLLKLIIFISLFIFWAGFTSAQTVSLSPQNSEVAKNTTFSATVNVSSVTNLFGVSFDLDFNPSLVDFIDATEGEFLKQSCQTSLMTAENPAGKLIFGLTRLGSSCGSVSGSGTIATLNFKSLDNVGNSSLSFSKNSLCILNGSACNYITGTWNSGSVDVKVTADTTPPSAPTGLMVS